MRNVFNHGVTPNFKIYPFIYNCHWWSYYRPRNL